FSDPGPVFHTIVSIKNDGHYFCRAGGNRPDGLNEPVTFVVGSRLYIHAGNIPMHQLLPEDNPLSESDNYFLV
uniref:hypothetical protein n=1 Tax=Escherichia coli TaxID=562 RepID=UPI002447BF30